jgi:NADPH:quinone reductase-like Zn-dependent oxidoreductase
MKAIVIDRHGPPEVLRLKEIPEPKPGPGEVLVRLRAAGINFADLFSRLGLYPDAPKPPFTPGLEASGEIEAVGSDVGGLRAGQRVMVLARSGGYAEKMCVPAAQAVEMASEMSFEQGAALPVNYLTAYHMLFRMGSVRRGERVLIHAAAGGVGLAAIELCRIAGAEIFATASAAKFDFLRARGVEHLVDYRTQDFERDVLRMTGGEGVDMVLDAVGGETLQKSYRLLRPAGRLMTFGFSAAMTGVRINYWKTGLAWFRNPRFNPLRMMRENRAVIGVHIGHLAPETLREEYAALLRFFEEGRIQPYVGKTFPLAEASLAHRFIHERKNLGKVLLIP